MIGRFVVAVVLGVQILPAFAAPGLDLTAKVFRAGITKHIREIPQCSAAKLDAGRVIRDGAVIYHELKLNDALVDIVLDVSADGKISNARFLGQNGAKDDAQLNLMMCSTYAIMRTLQPDLESEAAARVNMKQAWEAAAQHPFEKSFYFNKIRTQYVPFEMNVY